MIEFALSCWRSFAREEIKKQKWNILCKHCLFSSYYSCNDGKMIFVWLNSFSYRWKENFYNFCFSILTASYGINGSIVGPEFNKIRAVWVIFHFFRRWPITSQTRILKNEISSFLQPRLLDNEAPLTTFFHQFMLGHNFAVIQRFIETQESLFYNLIEIGMLADFIFEYF